jgi:hypothetical protein
LLHVADLRVTCNFSGRLFKLLLRKMEGRNDTDRCSFSKKLWGRPPG